MHEIYMCYVYRKHIGAYKLKLYAHIYAHHTNYYRNNVTLKKSRDSK